MHLLIDRLRAVPTNYLLVFIVVLFIPAHLINLGMAAFIGDEAIRALVALEMDLSGNYIATTMCGEPYLNKPPLFNWMILAATKLMGGYSELPSRLITVFFLAVFGWTVFRFVRQHFTKESAFFAAMMTVTSGRFLFYDSMLGLIDTTFTWLMYLLFMSIWYFGKREQWLKLFLGSYFLMGVGFLLKGFRAIVFEGLSLLAGLYFFGKLKLLFSWKHVAGIAIAASIIGSWLAAYAQYQPLNVLIPNLLHESVKRTVVNYTIFSTLYHTVEFPFYSLYHFLPFSLLLIFLIDNRLWQKIKSNDFVYFNFLILAFNLPVYWTSSQVMPRYLLMFIPLFNVIGLYLLEQNRIERTWRYKGFYWILGGLLAFSPLITVAMPFIPQLDLLPGLWLISIILTLVFAALVTLYFADRERFLWWFITALLIVRIGFDLVILPVRHHENDISNARRDAIQMADKYRDRHWYVWGDTEVRDPVMFYITTRLGYIVKRTDQPDIPNALYLVNMSQCPEFEGTCLDTLRTDYKTITLLLFKQD